MDEVLHAYDAKLAQGALNQVVGGDGGAVASDLRRESIMFQFFLTFDCITDDRVLYQTFPDIMPMWKWVM